MMRSFLVIFVLSFSQNVSAIEPFKAADHLAKYAAAMVRAQLDQTFQDSARAGRLLQNDGSAGERSPRILEIARYDQQLRNQLEEWAALTLIPSREKHALEVRQVEERRETLRRALETCDSLDRRCLERATELERLQSDTGDRIESEVVEAAREWRRLADRFRETGEQIDVAQSNIAALTDAGIPSEEMRSILEAIDQTDNSIRAGFNHLLPNPQLEQTQTVVRFEEIPEVTARVLESTRSAIEGAK